MTSTCGMGFRNTRFLGNVVTEGLTTLFRGDALVMAGNRRVTVKLSAQLVEGLRRSRLPGETVEAQLRRYLALAGGTAEPHALGRRGRPGGERGPHGALYRMEAGTKVFVHWLGERDPVTGLPPSDQSRVYTAVRRCAQRTGFVFERGPQDTNGFWLHRIL